MQIVTIGLGRVVLIIQVMQMEESKLKRFSYVVLGLVVLYVQIDGLHVLLQELCID
jgi:hypothetical protein